MVSDANSTVKEVTMPVRLTRADYLALAAMARAACRSTSAQARYVIQEYIRNWHPTPRPKSGGVNDERP
jgi:hypothetical protein